MVIDAGQVEAEVDTLQTCVCEFVRRLLVDVSLCLCSTSIVRYGGHKEM